MGCARRYRGADDRGSRGQADGDAAVGQPDRGRELPGPLEIDLKSGAAAHPEGPFHSLEQPGGTCAELLALVEQLRGVHRGAHRTGQLPQVEASGHGERVQGGVELGSGQLHPAESLADQGQ